MQADDSTFAATVTRHIDPVVAPRGFPRQAGYQADDSVLFHCDGTHVADVLARYPAWHEPLRESYGSQEIVCLDLWVQIEGGRRTWSLEIFDRDVAAVAGPDAMKRLDELQHAPLDEWARQLAEIFDAYFASLEAADGTQVVTASRDIAASAESIFELIADPSQQPRWDGNDNLGEAPTGQRVRGVGDVFVMALKSGSIRDNHVVEFEEGRRIAWRPADQGMPPAGHLWRWELEPTGASTTRVTHTYDWSQLTDEKRFERARSTTPAMLRASIDRLADLAEEVPGSGTNGT